MSLLKTEPPAPVASLPELFALAHALEEEAATRYAALAEQMDALQLSGVAAAFRHLAEEERGHAHNVEGWAQRTIGAPPDHALIRWQPPETFDEEEARQIASSRLASAYRALSMAVRNEERAFALWTYIAAQAESADIREAAERMAGEELRHAALFRRERRRAWREERGAAAVSGAPMPLARALAAERQLASLLLALADEEQANLARRAAMWRLAGEAAAMADELTALDVEEAAPATPAEATPDGLRGAWRWAEQAAEAYIDAADAGRDEELVRRLQSLAERSIARVAALRHAVSSAEQAENGADDYRARKR